MENPVYERIEGGGTVRSSSSSSSCRSLLRYVQLLVTCMVALLVAILVIALIIHLTGSWANAQSVAARLTKQLTTAAVAATGARHPFALLLNMETGEEMTLAEALSSSSSGRHIVYGWGTVAVAAGTSQVDYTFDVTIHASDHARLNITLLLATMDRSSSGGSSSSNSSGLTVALALPLCAVNGSQQTCQGTETASLPPPPATSFIYALNVTQWWPQRTWHHIRLLSSL